MLPAKVELKGPVASVGCIWNSPCIIKQNWTSKYAKFSFFLNFTWFVNSFSLVLPGSWEEATGKQFHFLVYIHFLQWSIYLSVWMVCKIYLNVWMVCKISLPVPKVLSFICAVHISWVLQIRWLYFTQLIESFAEDKAAVSLIHRGRVNSMAVINWGNKTFI